MNEKILPDDPRLTAYALGELEGHERDAIEAALRDNPAAQAAVEKIRATARELEGALAHEPLRRSQTIPNKSLRSPAGSKDPYVRPKKGALLRFPQIYYVISGLAAACFVAVMVWREPQVRREEKKIYRELTLALPPTPHSSQDAATSLAATATKTDEDGTKARNTPVALSPFAVAAEEMIAPAASASLRGTRIRAASGLAMDINVSAGTVAYAYRKDSDFLAAAENPFSTFSVDVGTASYANVRRFLQNGQRPPPDAVRIEELINYFPYRYAPPTGDAPVTAALEVADAPWAPGHRLVRIGLKGREIAPAERGATNLVFLLDVSGSMNEPNKLPLVKESLRLLVGRLRAADRVAIVTYAGASGLALPSTPVAKARDILAALDRLEPSGSTNGARGIELAYEVAKAHFVADGVNRVILCTDGDFNVGATSEAALTRLVTEKAKSGVFLTVLGFGMGKSKDATLEQLAAAGNGNYGYIDTRREAEKLLVGQVEGTLVTVAQDVNVQVEFNPAKVASYRLIGYENRLLKKEDVNNNAVDAGEIGAGDTVTALYEIVPAGLDRDATSVLASVDPLKDQRQHTVRVPSPLPSSEELLTLKVRYKDPVGEVSRKLEFVLTDRGERFAKASGDFKLAAAVAAFGLVLRDSPYKGTATLATAATWVESVAGADPGGYRAELLGLVRRAEALQ